LHRTDFNRHAVRAALARVAVRAGMAAATPRDVSTHA